MNISKIKKLIRSTFDYGGLMLFVVAFIGTPAAILLTKLEERDKIHLEIQKVTQSEKMKSIIDSEGFKKYLIYHDIDNLRVSILTDNKDDKYIIIFNKNTDEVNLFIDLKYLMEKDI